MQNATPNTDRSLETSPFVSLRGIGRDFVTPMTIVQSTLAKLGADYREIVVHAVSDVDLEIPKGTVVGLVGESGCGKSTLGRIAAALIKPTTGQVHLEGKRMDLGSKDFCARDMLRTQMVFQNPMASLNPRQKVVDIITEGAICHGLLRRQDKFVFAEKLLAEVGLSADALERLPHQFSGGQRQRIGIARALAVEPDFLICDEPVAALDVSIQAQIINLLMELQKLRELTVLFISHDLGVVRHLCDSVAVMYLGRIVERAPTEQLFSNPTHPYTQALLAEMPSIKKGRRNYVPIVGEIPSPIDPPDGCYFHPRCPGAFAKCKVELPPEMEINAEHTSSCWLNE